MEAQRSEPSAEDVRLAAKRAGIALVEERVPFVHDGALFLHRSVDVCRRLAAASVAKAD
jgi:hypothetical protein